MSPGASRQSLRTKLVGERRLVGTWLTLTDPVAAEIARESGLEFAIVDGEHAPLGPETIHLLVGALRGGAVSAVVRVPANEPVYFATALDAGADGVLVPQVRSADDVARAVRSSRYPPEGARGWGPRRPSGYGRDAAAYRAVANDNAAVIIQVELKEAVENLASILRVDGFDAVLVGPNDLAGSLGHPGEITHPEVQDTIRSIIDSCVSGNVPVGIACGGEPAEILRWFEAGCRFVAAAADYLVLAQGYDRLAGSI